MPEQSETRRAIVRATAALADAAEAHAPEDRQECYVQAVAWGLLACATALDRISVDAETRQTIEVLGEAIKAVEWEISNAQWISFTRKPKPSS